MVNVVDKELAIPSEGPAAKAGNLQDELTRLKAQAPEWFDLFEEIDPAIASRAEVKRLIDSAPDVFARGLVMGMDMIRFQNAMVTGRAY